MTLYHGSTLEVREPKIIRSDHVLIRATLVTAIVGILAAHWGISEDEAMRRFYASKTALAFADDETGLYGM